MSSTRYQEFTVSGSPREMGNQIGEQAGDLVSRFCEVALESANRMATASPEFAREVSAKSLEFAREYSPDLVDELEGIAEASNVDILDLTLAQVRNQFTDDNDNACTSFSASPSFVSDGHHIVAQTWDADPALDEVTIVLTRKPENAPDYISVGQAGLIGYMGFNTAGIGCCVNTLPAPIRGIGVPHYFSLRRLFEQTSLDDAVHAVESAHRAIPVNIMMTTPQGPANIEATVDEVFLLRDENYLVHTNHCLHDTIVDINKDFPELCDSYSRFPRMTELVEQSAANISKTGIEQMFKDHDGYPGSICRHANPDDPKHGFIETVFAMIVDTQAQEMYVSRGNPCTAPFETYRMI